MNKETAIDLVDRVINDRVKEYFVVQLAKAVPVDQDFIDVKIASKTAGVDDEDVIDGIKRYYESKLGTFLLFYIEVSPPTDTSFRTMEVKSIYSDELNYLLKLEYVDTPSNIPRFKVRVEE